jgi:SRSO17 transposase
VSLRYRHEYAADLPRGLHGQQGQTIREVPHLEGGHAPRPAHIRQVRAGEALRDVTTPVPRVLLSVTLAGPEPSGSAGPSRLCQGCSHPPRHHPGRAALSFPDLLRQARGEGLPPPLESTAPHGARPRSFRDEYETAVCHMVEAAEVARTRRADLLQRLTGCFARREPATQAGRYIDGLASDLPRKNGWTLAEHAGDDTPDKMQRLLNHSRWDHRQAQQVVREFVIEHLGDGDAVLVLDESGQEKTGCHTAGVKRQYVGCVGKVTNAVNVVYATYASGHGHATVAARLYLPAEWADDELRRRAKIPDEVTFATKPQLAVQILAEFHAHRQLPPFITGDEVYGNNPALRSWCEQHQVGYVLGVPCSFTLTLGCGTRMRAEQAVRLVNTHGWNYRSAGAGSKGERDYAWAWIATASSNHHLLVRRSLKDPTDLAYFYCYSPPSRLPATLAVLVRVAGMRWPVEEDLCATRRPAVSPTQLGGTRREVPGSDDLPGAERLRGQEHVRKLAAVSRRKERCAGGPA